MEQSTALTKHNQPEGIRALMSNDSVKAKFAEILGKNSAAFISAVTTLATTTKLAECEPKSILGAAIGAAGLNLPVAQSLGFAAIVPYGKQAQLQIMSRGYIQLALRSGQFKTINVTEIYEGELKSEDRLTGEYDFNGKRTGNKIIGYVAFFELLNGFKKSLYMTTEQVEAHGKRFSKTFSFSGSPWKTNFDGMSKKTVLKLLISRYAPMSVELQNAIIQDQAAITSADDATITEFTYVDNAEAEDAQVISEPVVSPEVTATRRTQKQDK